MSKYMFEKASILKLRFQTSKGLVTTEQLWDLPLESHDGCNLDGIAKVIDTKIRLFTGGSFVSPKNDPAQVISELMLDIVKHIIAVKLEHLEQ